MFWLWIIVGLVYLLSRVDLIPDVLAPWGWIDDGIVLMMVYRQLARLARRRHQGPRPDDSGERQQSEGRGRSAPGTGPEEHRNPYEVLGVSPPADQQEIRSAYLKLANQYHPDKVAHLGKEFQELAERRFKEIQQAYDALTENRAR